jgi:hypothetical protein
MSRAATGLLLVFCLNTTMAHAEKRERVALVIGNSEYTAAGRLVNPENDAKDGASVRVIRSEQNGPSGGDTVSPPRRRRLPKSPSYRACSSVPHLYIYAP